VVSTALAHVFDTGHVTGAEYSNVVKPGQVPMGGMGAIPVIARLVCADGAEEWWPARAVRWTEDAVLVGYESLPWRSEQPSSSLARYRRRRPSDPPSSRPRSV